MFQTNRIFAILLYLLFKPMPKSLTIRIFVVAMLANMFFCACSDVRHSEDLLSQADSIVESNPDSALVLLRRIGGAESLSGDGERALYYLLLTQAQYKCYEPVTADSLMPFCVSHFASCGDSYNHVRALYYSALTGRPGRKPDEAVSLLKECERVAASTGNLLYQVKVYEALGNLNDDAGNYLLNLKYAKLFLDKAMEYGDPSYQAYAIMDVAKAYAILEHGDSALYIIKQALPVVNRLDSKAKALTLANVGVCYHEVGDDVNAKKYLLWSLRVRPRSNALKVLADIYNNEGKPAEALALWRRALAISTPSIRISTLKSMADYYASREDYRQAYGLCREVTHLSDSVSKAMLDSRITELQLKYDHQLQVSRYYRLAFWCILASVVLALTVLFVILAFRRHVRLAKKSLQKKDAELDDVRSRYGDLEAVHATDAAKIEELSRLFGELSTDTLLLMSTGKTVYSEIETTGRFPYSLPGAEKGFVLYFAMQNIDVFNGWLKAYDKLTISELVYLTLDAMGYSDKEKAGILSVSESAVRTRKYRLNKTKKAK